MKALLFVPDARCPAMILNAIKAWGVTNGMFEEIEIPPDGKSLSMQVNQSEGRWISQTISLPQKQKVKKWQFLVINHDQFKRPRAEVTGWITDEAAFHLGYSSGQKIVGTMIEIEE